MQSIWHVGDLALVRHDAHSPYRGLVRVQAVTTEPADERDRDCAVEAITAIVDWSARPLPRVVRRPGEAFAARCRELVPLLYGATEQCGEPVALTGPALTLTGEG